MIDTVLLHKKQLYLLLSLAIEGAFVGSTYLLKNYAFPNAEERLNNLTSGWEPWEEALFTNAITTTVGLATGAAFDAAAIIIANRGLKAAVNSRVSRILAESGDVEAMPNPQDVLIQVFNEIAKYVAPGLTIALHSSIVAQNNAHPNEILLTITIANIPDPCHIRFWNWVRCCQESDQENAVVFAKKFGIHKEFKGYVNKDIPGAPHPENRAPVEFIGRTENQTLRLNKACFDKMLECLNRENRTAVLDIYYKIARGLGVVDPRPRQAAVGRPVASTSGYDPRIPLLRAASSSVNYNGGARQSAASSISIVDVASSCLGSYAISVTEEKNTFKQDGTNVLKICHDARIMSSQAVVNKLFGYDKQIGGGIYIANPPGRPTVIIIPDRYFQEIGRNLSPKASYRV